jgi:predicted Fe-Mo cluster-binding NifX family protein
VNNKKNMKIAISSTGNDLNAAVADVFGRCPYFILAEIEEQKIIKTEALKNISGEQTSGAGIAATQLMADNEVEAVIAKNVGPKAMEALKKFNIQVYNGNGTVAEAVRGFIAK